MIENPEFFETWQADSVTVENQKKPVEYSGPFCLVPAELDKPF